MKPTFCKFAFDHQPGETCAHCNLPVDQYGNTENDFPNCCFPHCGCDGARLCMAHNPNDNARQCNVEGMYERKDLEAQRAKLALIGLCMDKK